MKQLKISKHDCAFHDLSQSTAGGWKRATPVQTDQLIVDMQVLTSIQHEGHEDQQ